MHVGTVESVNTSRGGVPKIPVFEAHVGALGLDGDHQNDTRHHGGPDRAVVLFSLDAIRALQQEGHPIGIGTTGENLTVSGLDWPSIGAGTELQAGTVRLVVTRYATPCRNIRHSFKGADFNRISQDVHPGWSRVCARVVSGGVVRRGDRVTVVTINERGPERPVARTL